MTGTVRFVFCMTAGTICVVRGGSLLQQQPGGPVFHSGARLVEVDVVVRDGNGPGPRPFGPPGAIHRGLTKDDFVLLDDGKPQPIAVFRERAAGVPDVLGAGDAQPIASLPGAVSNRLDADGQPLNGATAVLIDQLNTKFDLKGYERAGVVKLLGSLVKTDHIALYSMGAKIHLLQDFTSDPQKVSDAIAKLDQGLDLIPTNLEDILQDYPESAAPSDCYKSIVCRQAEVNVTIHDALTLEALAVVVRNLSRVAGRKNLVWLMDEPQVPPAVMAMLQQANIALYPVLVRLVGDSGVLASAFKKKGQLASFTETLRERAAQSLAAATGGRAFFDSMDLTAALRTAEEDSHSAYVLGYYPSEDMLDGKYHKISVQLRNAKPNPKGLEVTYRPGYLAAKLPPVSQILQSPFESTSVGLAAQVQPDSTHAGQRQIRVAVDLHDLRLQLADGRFTGAFDFFLEMPGMNLARSRLMQLSIPEARMPELLEIGFTLNIGGVSSDAGEVRVIVRDRETGAAGSLTIPVGKQ
jgi:VWFA-related protein